MKRLLLLLLPLLSVMQGCTKEESKGQYNGGGSALVISAGMEFMVSDGQGNDLLNPTSASPKAVDFSKVKVYFLRNGKEELFLRENLDDARGLRLIKPELDRTRYRMLVYTDCESGEDISTTILEWDDGHRDIIKAEFYRPRNGSIIQRKVWINDKLIWDSVNRIGGMEPTYEITR